MTHRTVRPGDIYPYETIAVDAVPHPGTQVEFQLMKRRRSVVMHGRIDLNKQPSFVGTFDLACPSSRFFEVHNDSSGGFSGIIEDVYGRAHFQGEIDASRVRFSKQYEPFWLTTLYSTRPFDGPIEYEGTSDDEQLYAGMCSIGLGKSRPFVMRRGAELGDY